MWHVLGGWAREGGKRKSRKWEKSVCACMNKAGKNAKIYKEPDSS